jgi:RNA polymerase sigma-70 factor (ECF subfamily)
LAVAAKRDRAAFGVLYDRYVERVDGYCYRRLQTPQDAEDATSQVFTSALAALPRYRDDGPSFGAWLFAIAHNLVVDELRSRRVARRAFALVDDVMPGPEEQAIVAADARELRALLARLPEEQAQLIELRLAGLTDKEIAFVLGRSYGAVRSAQHRAIRRLRELFGIAAKGSDRE